jgi:hypothetical protein
MDLIRIGLINDMLWGNSNPRPASGRVLLAQVSTTKIPLKGADGRWGLDVISLVRSSCNTSFPPMFPFRVAIRNRGREMQLSGRRY